MYGELERMASNDRLSIQSWSPERLFVSFLLPFYQDHFSIVTFHPLSVPQAIWTAHTSRTHFTYVTYYSSFTFQGILVYMFRELAGYCVSIIASPGYYSLAIQLTITLSYVMLCFWAGSVYHRVCLSTSKYVAPEEGHHPGIIFPQSF